MAIKSMTLENLKRFASNIKTWANDSFVKKETGKGLSSNDYTGAEKEKLAGIEAGAQVNVIETVKVNGTVQTVTEKAINIDLSKYALKTDLTSAVKWQGAVATVGDLPTNAQKGDMWHVESSGAEYVYNGEGWENVGTIVNLEPYSTTEEMNAAISAAVQPKANTSYVTQEIQRVEGIINGLDIPEGVIVDDVLSATSTNAIQNKVVTGALDLKVDKETYNGKVSELTTAIGKKVDQTAYDTKIQSIEGTLSTKANSADVYFKTETYTQTQINSAIETAAGTVDTRLTNELATLNPIVSGKADKSYVDTQLDLKVNSADIIAFTNDEIDSATA